MKISRNELVDLYWDYMDFCDMDEPYCHVTYVEGDECCTFHYDILRELLILDEYSNDKSTTTLTIPPQFDVLDMYIDSSMSFSTVDLSNIKYVTAKCRLERIKRLKKIIGLNLTEPGFCILYNKLADRDFVLDCLRNHKSLELVVDAAKNTILCWLGALSK